MFSQCKIEERKCRRNVIENVIEISEEKIKKLMPEYSKKKLAKA